MSTVLRQWMDEMLAGRLSIGDLVGRLNQRGKVAEPEHLREMEDLDALLRDGKLDPKLYRAVRSKLAELQGASLTQTRTPRPAAAQPPPPPPPPPEDDADEMGRTRFMTVAMPAVPPRPPASPPPAPTPAPASPAAATPPRPASPPPAPPPTVPVPPDDVDDNPMGATVALSGPLIPPQPEPPKAEPEPEPDTPPEFLATIAMNEPILPRAPGATNKPFEATVAIRSDSASGEDGTRVRAPAPGSSSTTGTGRSRTGSNTSGSNTGGSSQISAQSWQRLSQVAAPDQQVGTGSRLKDRFLLEREIGRGGMGVVYLALDERKVEARDRNPRVAVKVLNDEFRRHPDSLIALQRESRKAQQLAHDHIVRVYDFDKDGAVVFMTMEYVDGSDLKQLIRSLDGRGMAIDEAFPLIEGMAQALGRAHREGIVHSDFKPGNVMLTANRMPKVFDFGIARAGKRRGEQVGEQTVFDAGSLGALTPAYASLEMLRGTDPEPADDIYALACVTYELLGGRHPFDKVNAEQAQKQGLVPLRIPGLSNLQWKTLAKGLAFERNDRLQSAEELIEGLRPRTFQERALPYAVAGIGGLVVLGLLLWLGLSLHYRSKVSGVDGCIASGECSDAAVLAAHLGALDLPDQARVREARLDDIKGIFFRSLAQRWAPEQGRYGYADAKPVVELAFQLYGRDSAWVNEFSDGLESSRNKELSRLNDEFNRRMDQGVYASAQDDGRPFAAVLDAVRTIDPTQALLKDGRLAEAFDRGIRAGLADSTVPAAAQLALASKRLDVAKATVPDPSRLKPLEADLATRRQQIAASAADQKRAADAAAERDQRMDAVASTLADASDTPAWQAKMRGAWTAARESSPANDPTLAQLGSALAETLMAQSAQKQAADDLDGAMDSARFGLELMPGEAKLDQQLKALAAARDKRIAQAKTEAERTRLGLARFDELLARPSSSPSWFAEVDGAQKALAGRARPEELAPRRDKLADAAGKLVDELVAAPDFARADQIARLAAALDPSDPRLSALPGKVASGRRAAQAGQVARLHELVGAKAFTPDWEKAIDGSLAALKGVDDPSLPAELASLQQAYADRTDALAKDRSYDAARQVVGTGLKRFPQSVPIKAAMARVDDLDKADRVDRDQQQAQFKIQELERTIPLKAAASEIPDAIAALAQLKKLDAQNTYANTRAPQQIADGSLKLAERFAAKKDYDNALKAADRGLAVMKSPDLQAARDGYEQSGCTTDLDREARSRGTLPDARRVFCLALVKRKLDAPTYARYRPLEQAVASAPATPVAATTASTVPAPAAAVPAVPVPRPAQDPCRKDFAGNGTRARAQCADTIAADGTKGPLMVVISGLGNFAIGRFEVSNAEFGRYCKATAACPPPIGEPSLPASRVGVAQALSYIKWLSDLTGRRYRLPTENEWEFAATVGGKDPLAKGQCLVTRGGKIASGGTPRAAASGEQNDWGIVNAVGNVWEMTQGGGGIVLRGGGFEDEGHNCSAEARKAFAGPETSVGLRVVRELD